MDGFNPNNPFNKYFTSGMINSRRSSAERSKALKKAQLKSRKARASKTASSSNNDFSSASSVSASSASSGSYVSASEASLKSNSRSRTSKQLRSRYYHRRYQRQQISDDVILYPLNKASHYISHTELDKLMKPTSIVTKEGHRRIYYQFRTTRYNRRGRPKKNYAVARLIIGRPLLAVWQAQVSDVYKIPMPKVKQLSFSALTIIEGITSLPNYVQEAIMDSLGREYKKCRSTIIKIQRDRDKWSHELASHKKVSRLSMVINQWDSLIGGLNRNYRLLSRHVHDSDQNLYALLISQAVLIDKLITHSTYSQDELDELFQNDGSLKMLDSLLSSGNEARHRYKTENKVH